MTNRFTLQWIIDETNEQQLVRDFLYEKEISKTALTQIKYHGGKISVNDEEVTVRYVLKRGDCLTVSFPEEQRSDQLQIENLPLDIVYEDEYLIVVNKSAQMNTIPSREHPKGSVINALLGYYDRKNIFATAHVVTRLDRDTTGLLLIAKHRHIHHLFSKQQRKGKIKRIYEAFAHGVINKQHGTIEQPIARKETSIIEREVNTRGQYACTHYTVLATYNNFTHLQLELETGRTHQIRVHLAYIGHPLLGDELYGGKRGSIFRQALHCSQIGFVHPMTGEKMQFFAPLHTDMAALLAK